MCYLLVIAAPESGSAEISELTVGELSTWPEANASISSVIPADYALHAIGVGHHCSCSCVQRCAEQSATSGTTLALESEAAQIIEMAVKVVGQLAFIVHWISSDLQSEECQVEFGAGISTFMLSQPHLSFEIDQLVWVAE